MTEQKQGDTPKLMNTLCICGAYIRKEGKLTGHNIYACIAVG